ncbi:MAG: hypothetical protein GHCLOJNM_03302 [bacterium]|nr:hypothetical protein [bacterium]
MERISWIRAILDHATDPAVECWTNLRGTSTHHLVWFKEEYLIVLKEVLRKRDNFRYFVLKTAYCTTSERTVATLRRERDASGLY